MPETVAPGLQLLTMINGYQLSQAISTAAELRIADALAAGPRSAAEIAPVVGAHPDALHRLLRALASAALLHESEEGLFELTPSASRCVPMSPVPSGAGPSSPAGLTTARRGRRCRTAFAPARRPSTMSTEAPFGSTGRDTPRRVPSSMQRCHP